jgi:hypothetical protein
MNMSLRYSEWQVGGLLFPLFESRRGESSMEEVPLRAQSREGFRLQFSDDN